MARSRIHPRFFASVRPITAGALLDIVSIYRSPAASGGKTGAPVLHLSDEPATLIPADEAGDLIEAVPGLAGGRTTIFGLLRWDVDCQVGDELRTADGRRLKVEGVAQWRVELAVGLSELQQP